MTVNSTAVTEAIADMIRKTPGVMKYVGGDETKVKQSPLLYRTLETRSRMLSAMTSPEILVIYEGTPPRDRGNVNHLVSIVLNPMIGPVSSSPPEDFPTPSDFAYQFFSGEAYGAPNHMTAVPDSGLGNPEMITALPEPLNENIERWTIRVSLRESCIAR